jgi:hypothetical protein
VTVVHTPPGSTQPAGRERHPAREALGVNPAERVKFVVQTAKAVLDGRLDVDQGAAAVQLQAEQLTPLLRGDRDSVTRSEAESVATTLRLLAEQVNDQASGLADPSDHEAMARSIGEMAQALR